MRIEQGAPFIDPARGNVKTPGDKKRTDKADSKKESTDTVQISEKARELHADKIQRTDDNTVDVGVRDDERHQRLESIQGKIDSGFYETREAHAALAEELLTVFGI